MTKTIPINETFYLGFQSMKIVLKTMSCISTNENSHQNFMHHCNSHKIYHEVHNLNCWHKKKKLFLREKSSHFSFLLLSPCPTDYLVVFLSTFLDERLTFLGSEWVVGLSLVWTDWHLIRRKAQSPWKAFNLDKKQMAAGPQSRTVLILRYKSSPHSAKAPRVW